MAPIHAPISPPPTRAQTPATVFLRPETRTAPLDARLCLLATARRFPGKFQKRSLHEDVPLSRLGKSSFTSLLLATRVETCAPTSHAAPGLCFPLSINLTWRAPRVLHRFRAVAAADVVRRRSSTRGGVSGGSLLGHLPLALMGACFSMSAAVGPDGDERIRERLGAPTAATCSAPRRVDTQAWRCLPCAVRLQGAHNPLIHILSIAQLMEINEAFNRFGAPCCMHPRGLLRSAQLAP